MPYEPDRLRPTLAAESDALAYAALPGAAGAPQLAETRVEPISVPRPQPFDTVTIGVVTGRPLTLEFTVGEVKTREVARDDLILGFENGGKVVLKDYMHAFGLLGDQRTTIIQPDGKHYAFTELLAPTAGAKPETPAPGAGPNVLVVEKPAPGETQRFKLSAEKPTALNFGKSDVAAAEVDKAGDLVVTFKDRAVLVLEGYTALKGSGDIALYFTKGDKAALGDLAPGAAPEGGAPEGGHLFTQFDPGSSPGPFDHLGALGPEPVSLIAPPGPPDSPPPAAPPPPETPPPEIPPPEVARSLLIAEAARDAGASTGAEDAEASAAGLTLIVAPDMDIGGDVASESGRWSEAAPGNSGQATALGAEAVQRGWIEGHDPPAEAAGPTQAAALAATPGDAGPAMSAEPATAGTGAPDGGAPMSSQDVFDSADAAPDAAPARAEAGAGTFAAAFDFAAAAHAETPAPPVQNSAQHNVMGHG